jgi:hypothetical protein
MITQMNFFNITSNISSTISIQSESSEHINQYIISKLFFLLDRAYLGTIISFISIN